MRPIVLRCPIRTVNAYAMAQEKLRQKACKEIHGFAAVSRLVV
jgi:hypothetical protein